MGTEAERGCDTDGPAPDNTRVSIVICTRNRRDSVVLPLLAVLRSAPDAAELIIVDQSDDDATHQALRQVCTERPSVRYYRLRPQGKPRALTYALHRARGPYVVLTDDDCEPQSGWLPNLLAPMEADPAVACVFGQVLAAPHDPAAGYIPEALIREPAVISRPSDYLRLHRVSPGQPDRTNCGIGANMALRRSAVLAASGWDPCLGPGARFANGDDYDLAVRLLRAGHRIAFTPESRVTHYGFRLWAQARRDALQWGISYGAVFAKHLKCGLWDYGSARMLGQQIRQAAVSVAHLRRPHMAQIGGWLWGFAGGLAHRVDRRTRQFLLDGPGLPDEATDLAVVVLRSEQTHSDPAAGALPADDGREGPASR